MDSARASELRGRIDTWMVNTRDRGPTWKLMVAVREFLGDVVKEAEDGVGEPAPSPESVTRSDGTLRR